jgi:hypothetical protein
LLALTLVDCSIRRGRLDDLHQAGDGSWGAAPTVGGMRQHLYLPEHVLSGGEAMAVLRMRQAMSMQLT